MKKIYLTLMLNILGIATVFSQTYSEIMSTGLDSKSLSSIAAGDLDNDGYIDLVTTGLNGSSELTTTVYLNNADGTFTNINAGLTPMYNATIALGDYDKDGDLDILLSGEGYDPIAELWKNNGNMTFSLVSVGLDNVGGNNAEFGDLDGDGDLDILIAGMIKNPDNSYSNAMRLYSNEGGDSFIQIELTLTDYAVVGTLGDYDNDGDLDLLKGGASLEIYPNNGDGTFGTPTNLGSFPGGKMKWFDYNKDLKLDYILSGRDFAGDYFTKIYKNTGSGFEVITSTLPSPTRQNLDLRDYNGDGFVDLLLTGTLDVATKSYVTKIYDNNGESFAENTSITLPQLGNGDGKWIDLDNDGDLDLVITGVENQGGDVKQTLLYRNTNNTNSFTPNTLPTAPTAFSASGISEVLLLEWSTASDTETPAAELYYNIGFGTSAGATDIVSPESDVATGYRQVVKPGNAQNLKGKEISGLADGLYYMIVQTLDGSWAGSPFSDPQKVAMGLPANPDGVTAEVSGSDVIVSWNDNAVNEFSYEAEYNSNLNSTYQLGGGVLTDETSVSIPGLGSAIYTFRVKAFNPNGESDYAMSDRLVVGLPAAPANFTSSASGADVVLQWDNTVNETSFQIERSKDSPSNFQLLAIVNEDILTHSDESPGGGEYLYRIKSINPNGESDFVTTSESVIILGINEINRKSVSLFPNPVVNGRLCISPASGVENLGKITITNLLGIPFYPEVTKSQGKWFADVTDYPEGLYMLNFETSKGIISGKFMIIR